MDYLNSVINSIQFTEKEKMLKKSAEFNTRAYHMPTVTGQYINFNFHHTHGTKKYIIRCLHHREKVKYVVTHTHANSINTVLFRIISTLQISFCKQKQKSRRRWSENCHGLSPLAQGFIEKDSEDLWSILWGQRFRSSSTLRRNVCRVKLNTWLRTMYISSFPVVAKNTKVKPTVP